MNNFSRVLFFTAGKLVARGLLGGLPCCGLCEQHAGSYFSATQCSVGAINGNEVVEEVKVSHISSICLEGRQSEGKGK